MSKAYRMITDPVEAARYTKVKGCYLHDEDFETDSFNITCDGEFTRRTHVGVAWSCVFVPEEEAALIDKALGETK